MKPLLIIVIITGLLNLFYTRGEGAAGLLLDLYHLSGGHLGGGVYGATHRHAHHLHLPADLYHLPILLTDGLEKLMGPLKTLHVPVHELSMMMSIALRFIPTLIEETDKIMSAQKARGVNFDTGNLLQKAKALGAPAGTPVHFCLPPGRRACHCHGVPLLPRRRGPHPPAPAQAKGIDIAALVFAVLLCRHRRAAALWTLRKK